MIIIDRFGQRVVRMPHTGDMVYDADIGDDAVDQEDVVLIGPWADYTGSDVNVTTRSQMMFAGVVNELQGTLADHVGEDLNNLTDRGKTASTHRQRRIKRYLKLDGK